AIAVWQMTAATGLKQLTRSTLCRQHQLGREPPCYRGKLEHVVESVLKDVCAKTARAMPDRLEAVDVFDRPVRLDRHYSRPGHPESLHRSAPDPPDAPKRRPPRLGRVQGDQEPAPVGVQAAQDH